MADQNSWEDKQVIKVNRTISIAIIISFFTFILFNLNSESQENIKVTEKSTNTSHISISDSDVESCLNRISESTGYDKTRLNYIGNDGKSIVATYFNNMGNVHKFKCNGNQVKLWAKGAEMWLDM